MKNHHRKQYHCLSDVYLADQVILIKLSPVSNITNVMTYENMTSSCIWNKYFHFEKGGGGFQITKNH